jgi:predicted transcriptional regulator
MPTEGPLTRREREILQILYRLGNASAQQVQSAMADPSSDSAVRTLIRLMEEKGLLQHTKQGRKYVYRPVVPSSRARRTALRSLLTNLCDGSVELAVASLLDLESRKLDKETLDRLAEMIEDARRPRSSKR